MKPVVGSIRRLSRLLISNVFLLDGGRGDRWLVDTGHWSERVTLLRELRRAGLRPGDLTGVLLTHRHSDHAGNAAFLQRRYGVKIHAHRDDAAVLEGRIARPMMGRGGEVTPLARLFIHIENLLPAAGLRVDRALEGGETIAGLEVHPVPGHTGGSVFYRHEATSSLLSGDMLLAAFPPLTIVQGMTLTYPAYAQDLRQAHESLRSFHESGLHYENLLAGHGRPILGGARERAMALLAGVGYPVRDPAQS
ncbi:MAG: MBL fold metallo-hydrolase [Polyangiaceae bacterium]|nr:MBL fold metallo-hydrolase [Polyangiaceae bacterium]